MRPRPRGPLSVLALALAACTPSGSAEAPTPTATPTPVATTPPEDGVSFASPPEPEASPIPPAPTDPELDARIKEKHGPSCSFGRACGDLVGIDCNAAADGPYYYARRDDLEIISRCGGHCMAGQCTNCPPAEWSCDEAD